MLDVIKVTTAGADGSGAGTQAGAVLHGFVEGISITLDAAMPDTTDVTITENGGLGRTILAVTNLTHGTTTIYNPQFQVNDNGGVAKTFYTPFYISSQSLLVTVAQGNAVTNGVIVKVVTWEASNN